MSQAHGARRRAAVTCIGGMTVDLIARPVDEMPQLGRLGLANTAVLTLGGCAQNCACALARLGTPVRLIGRIGADALGSHVVATLEARGVMTDALRVIEDAGTSTTICLVASDGERAFIHTIGATGRLDAAELDWVGIEESQILFVGQFGLLGAFDDQLATVLAGARERGILTALDTVWDPTGQLPAKIRPCLPLIDYFLPSHAEAEAITGLADPPGMAAWLLAQGVSTVVIKLGRDGCYVADADGGRYIPGFEVEQVDATGAGDAWCAGFLTGLLEVSSVFDAAALGNAVGACCVEALGTYDGVRSLPNTRAFMNATRTMAVR